MKASRKQTHFSFQDNDIQIFADISPTTIQRRRTLKLLLLILSQKEIKYWWGFPFALKFAFKGKTHSFTNLPEGEQVLLQLNLISQEPSMDTSNLQSSSAKCSTPTSSISPSWKTVKNRRVKEPLPT